MVLYGKVEKKKRKNLDGISIKGVLSFDPAFAFLDELDHLEAKKKN